MNQQASSMSRKERGKCPGERGRKYFVLLSCLVAVFGIGSCSNQSEQQLTPEQQQDLTKRIEKLIRNHMPEIEFTTTDQEAIPLAGETVPKSAGFSPEAPPKNDGADIRKDPPAIKRPQMERSIKTMGFSLLGFSFPWEKPSPTRAYQLYPKNRGKSDLYLFPNEEYVTSFRHEQLQKSNTICEKVREHRDTIMKDQYNYNVWSNLLGDLELELKKGPAKVKLPIKTSLLDDMVASFVILNLIPSETKFFVQGFADTCKSGKKDCWIGKLDERYDGRYKYEKVSIYPYKDADRTRNYEVNKPHPTDDWASEQVDRETVKDAKYSNLHLPELRAKFFKESFLDPRMKDCTLGLNHRPKVGILQGWAYEYEDPYMRRVELRVGVYSP